MKKTKITYLVSTGFLSLIMVFSASMYFLQNEMIQEAFTKLGYPTYIIYPLAGLKILGLVAIWSRSNLRLKEWAYAGFFFDLVLAATAHIAVNDNEQLPAIIAIVALLISYFSGKKYFNEQY
ncbi:DoxX family protein [Flammeovirga sp. SubArs3]|uniref:DoxX family protein n=1 Tax=Flammeovirga sp. SubArs3 TaxID=2995316 RepID=UPI00248B2F32|nr:DoxX family protein [Flammeovirga sp. SubArs3]